MVLRLFNLGRGGEPSWLHPPRGSPIATRRKRQGFALRLRRLVLSRFRHILLGALFVGVDAMSSFLPRDLASRMARQGRDASDGFIRETFLLPKEEAHAKARD